LRLGQDVTLSGHEASPLLCRFFPTTLYGKRRGLTRTEGVPRPARHSATVACSIIWPSFQLRSAHRGQRPASLGHMRERRLDREPSARARGIPGTHLGDTAQSGALAQGTLRDTASVPLTCSVSLEQENKKIEGRPRG